MAVSSKIKEKADKTTPIVVRPASVKKVRIPERIEEVSLKWLVDAPFYSEFLLRFNYYITDSIPTMGVNSTRGRINLYINEQFMNGGGKHVKIDKSGRPVIKKDKDGNPKLDKAGNAQVVMVNWKGLTDSQLEGVLIHEIMHLVRRHHERLYESDAYIWNIAGDMLINNDLIDAKIGRREIKLPDGAIYLSMAKEEGYDGEEVTEPLYAWLKDKQKEIMNQISSMLSKSDSGDGEGQSGEGSGEGSGEAGESTESRDLFDAMYGSNIDSHGKLEESDALAESTIKEAIDTAKIRGYGNISGNLSSRLDSLLSPAKLPWQKLLRKAMASYIYSHGRLYENTWARSNRRHLPLPGIKKMSNRVVIAVDTSGSIGQEEINQFFSEIEKIAKDGSAITLLQWDTKIQSVKSGYKRNDYRRIEVKGRGGTDVQCVFDWMTENKMNKDMLIVLTDGCFNMGFDHHNINTLWCITDNHSISMPNGKSVYLEINNK